MTLLAIRGKITRETADELIPKIQANPGAYLHLNTPGGNYNASKAIAKAVKASGTTVICRGMCYSGGCLIAAHSPRVLSAADCVWGYHPIIMAGSIPSAEEQDFIRTCEVHFADAIAQRSRLSFFDALKLLRESHEFSGREACEYGLADSLLN